MSGYYRPKNKAIVLDNDEIQKLSIHFINKRMAKDMAMFIATQHGVDLRNLFIYGEFVEIEFYRNVTTEIFNFIRYLIDNNKSIDVLNILKKFYFETYVPSNKRDYDYYKDHIEDYIQSELIDTIIYYLIELRKDEDLQLILGDIYGNATIPGPDIISYTVFHNKFDIDYKTLEYLINSEFVDYDVLMDNFYILLEKFDDEFIGELLLSIFSNKNERLGFALMLFRRYCVYNRFKDGKLVLECIPNYTSEQYKGFDFIKSKLRELIELDVETDFYYEFIDRGLTLFNEAEDKLRSNIYTKLNKWYVSKLENIGEISRIFINKGYVDRDKEFPLSDSEIRITASDINCLRFITAMESNMDLYDQVIRFINLSRFEFLQCRRKLGIEEMLTDLIYENGFESYLVFTKFNSHAFLSFILYL